MDATGGVFVISIAMALVAFWEYSRRKRNKILALGYTAFATVRAYRSEYVRVAGSWTTLDYPYVAYQDSAGVWHQERLKHATSQGREFFIGQLVEVVHFDAILYYRPDLEHKNFTIIGMALGAFLLGLTQLVPGWASWLNL